MLKLIDKIIFLISIIAMLSLLGAYTSSFVNPNTFMWPSILGLAYPYLLISNILLLLYWLVRWKKMIWAELLIILAGIPTFMTYYGTAGKQEKNSQYDLSLLSYNVRYFDLYKWSEQKDTKEKLFQYLNNFKGDIICLQEFSTTDNDKIKKDIVPQLKSYPYYHIHKDMAIFSRIPLINKGKINFETGHSASCLYCDAITAQDTIRLYSVHLESYKFGKKEREFMKEISQGLKSDDIPDGVKNLFSRLTSANKHRARQAKQIKAHLRNSPYKVILCGDFNDTPLSYTYRKIKEGLVDSFIEKGRGLGNTYIGEFPSFRIDYILHTTDIQTINYNREEVRLSDHYPICVELKISN